MQPTECEYCRCGEVLISSEAFVYFRCGTAYWPGTSQWTYANKCVETRVKKLEERVKRAVAVLEKAERHEMVIDQNGDIDWVEIPEGTVMLSAPANEAIAILKGEADEKAE